MARVKPEEYREEEDALNALINKFSSAMKEKLQQKRKEGWAGWADAENKGIFAARAIIHAERADLVDAANLLAMEWNLEGS